MLGFSPSEFAYMASMTTGVKIDQSSARRLDKRAREGRSLLARTTSKTQQQVDGTSASTWMTHETRINGKCKRLHTTFRYICAVAISRLSAVFFVIIIIIIIIIIKNRFLTVGLSWRCLHFSVTQVLAPVLRR
jgi:hypothetical protein